MFSKIILAALCSNAVYGSPATPVPPVPPVPANTDVAFKPIKVTPGCVDLWAGK
jgi:hypothetical protein